jgi:hypothetical protein
MPDEPTKPPRSRKAAVIDPAASPEQPKDNRTATIQTTAKRTRARGFTFGKGYVVPAVPIAHATFLKEQGEAEILEVKD